MNDLSGQESRTLGTTNAIPEILREEYHDFLRKNSLDVDKAEGQLKSYFKSEIVQRFRSPIIDALKKIGAEYDEIGERIKADRSVVYKWKNGDTQIGFESLFQAMAAFDVKGLRVRRGADAVFDTILETMTYIRSHLLGEECEPMDFIDLECVGVIWKPFWKFATYSKKNSLKRGEAAKELNERIRQRHKLRTAPYLSFEDAEARIENWVIPWIIFGMSIPYTWKY